MEENIISLPEAPVPEAPVPEAPVPEAPVPEKPTMPEYDQAYVSFQINKKTNKRECLVLEIVREKVKIRDEQANADNMLIDYKSIGHAKVWIKSGLKKEGDIID